MQLRHYFLFASLNFPLTISSPYSFLSGSSRKGSSSHSALSWGDGDRVHAVLQEERGIEQRWPVLGEPEGIGVLGSRSIASSVGIDAEIIGYVLMELNLWFCYFFLQMKFAK